MHTLPGPQGAGDTSEGAAEHVKMVTEIVWSASLEEATVNAAVVLLLVRARRPLWEILCVAALMRARPNAYLGWVALAPLALGVALSYLYLRYRRVLPLVAMHLAYDLLLFAPPPTVDRVLVLAGVPAALAALALPAHTPTRWPAPAEPATKP